MQAHASQTALMNSQKNIAALIANDMFERVQGFSSSQISSVSCTGDDTDMCGGSYAAGSLAKCFGGTSCNSTELWQWQIAQWHQLVQGGYETYDDDGTQKKVTMNDIGACLFSNAPSSSEVTIVVTWSSKRAFSDMLSGTGFSCGVTSAERMAHILSADLGV